MRSFALLVATVGLAAGCGGRGLAAKDEGGTTFTTSGPAPGGGGDSGVPSPGGSDTVPAPPTSDTELRARAVVADTRGAYVATEAGELVRFDAAGVLPPVALARGVGAPLALGAGHVYAAAQNDSGLVRVPRSGGEPALVAPRARALAIAVVGERAVALERSATGCELIAYASGGEAFDLATLDGCAGGDVVADASFVYLLHQRALMRVPLGGGAAQVVARDVADPGDPIADDLAAIYVARAAGIVAIAKADGHVSRVADAGGEVLGLAVGAHVTWLSRASADATTGTLYVAPKRGGVARKVAEGLASPTGIAVVGTTAFVSSLAAAVRRVPLPEE